MLDRYEPAAFEAKWQARWYDAELFRTREEEGRPKFYGLDFFPYPSGAGLSVGHCRNYIPTDVLCRMKVMQGYNVLHPMGFDAFGLPAENEAIKSQRHPRPMIDQYADTYRRQMDLVGVSYDWSRSFKSSDPGYYRWTQWIFRLLYQRGLAYRKMAAVNWCPKDKTALANEEVVGGLCERCGTPVEKRNIPQWFFRITEYAQRLIDDLDDLDWPEGIKNQQRNWIGRSEGVQFRLSVAEAEAPTDDDDFQVLTGKTSPSFEVFTTRIDTLFGATFCVLAPEHPLVASFIADESNPERTALADYCRQVEFLSETARQATDREKTGVFSGKFAINPGTGDQIPIYVADYVLMGYGTGAIMAVPAHDDRDLEFAQQRGLPTPVVIIPEGQTLQAVEEEVAAGRAVSSKDGHLVNSGEYSGLPVAEAVAKMGEWIEACGLGERKVNYKLRDWLISRQRYWGCPIPICYDKEGNEMLIDESALPVELPEVENYQPADDGSSPLARIPEFVNCTTPDGTLGRRETDTMGGFACSSWYFLRFCDPHNESEPWNLEKADAWMPVDTYVGGAEHAVMHLLYARFWTKVLYDAGLVNVHEPFARLQNQGQVLARTPYRQPREGERLDVGDDGILVSFAEAATMPESDLTWKWVRMSKSKGNVVTPDEAVAEYGADALRVYELFVAPFEADVQWSNEGMQGAVRFLSRVFRLVADLSRFDLPTWREIIGGGDPSDFERKLRRATHQLIQKVTGDIDRFAFNTAVSGLMTYVNTVNDLIREIDEPSDAERAAITEAMESLILCLSPMAPHSSDELWASLGRPGFTYLANWPNFDPDLAVDDEVTIAVQVNGKLRDTFPVAAGTAEAEVQSLALAREKIIAQIDGKTVRKVIVVPGKLVNIVAN